MVSKKQFRKVAPRKARRVQQAQSNNVNNDSAVKAKNEFNSLFLKIQNPPRLLGDTHRCTMFYRQQIPYTSVLSPQLYVFRGNGPYDPDVTGTGSQPVGFDQLGLFFTSYYVVGSRIKIVLINETVVPLQLSVVPAVSSTAVTTFDNSLLLNGVRYITVDGITKGGTSYKTLVSSQATLDIFGTNFDTNYSSAFTTNPSTQWYWLINFQSSDQATTISAELQVSIFYDVYAFGPKYLALS
jgi:hypothetical protein